MLLTPAHSNRNKMTIWQGGIHGTGFVSGPALPKLGIPTRTQTNILFHTLDWLPTLAEIVSVTPREGLDGVSQLNALKTGKFARQAVFLGYSAFGSDVDVYTPEEAHAAFLGAGGKWKLVRLPYANGSTKKYELYNLFQDKSEEKNVYNLYPRLANNFRQILDRFENSFPARIPRDETCGNVTFESVPWSEEARFPWCESQ